MTSNLSGLFKRSCQWVVDDGHKENPNESQSQNLQTGLLKGEIDVTAEEERHTGPLLFQVFWERQNSQTTGRKHALESNYGMVMESF